MIVVTTASPAPCSQAGHCGGADVAADDVWKEAAVAAALSC